MAERQSPELYSTALETYCSCPSDPCDIHTNVMATAPDIEEVDLTTEEELDEVGNTFISLDRLRAAAELFEDGEGPMVPGSTDGDTDVPLRDRHLFGNLLRRPYTGPPVGVAPEARSPSHASGKLSRVLAKSWNYTLNNYTKEEVTKLKELENVSYHVLGYEVGEGEETPHIQGFITFKKTCTMLRAIALLGFGEGRAHVEKTRNRKAMDKYCQKGGQFDIIDNRKQTAAGVKMKAVMELLRVTKGDISRVMDVYPAMYIRYHSGIHKIAARFAPKQRVKPRVTWLFGPTGSGKSLYVLQSVGENAYWHSGSYRVSGEWGVLVARYLQNGATFLIIYLSPYPCSGGVVTNVRKQSSSMTFVEISAHSTRFYVSTETE